jgi:hypothetical protein
VFIGCVERESIGNVCVDQECVRWIREWSDWTDVQVIARFSAVA